MDRETEGHSRTVTLLKVRNKQRTYITGFGLLGLLYFLDDFSGTFSAFTVPKACA